MNKEQVSGKLEQATGKVKEKLGETLNNQRLANSGVTDQVKGAAKEVAGNIKEAAKDHYETIFGNASLRRHKTSRTTSTKRSKNTKSQLKKSA
jgi:uncharacterized protein YjbJ (UPF0337 family)